MNNDTVFDQEYAETASATRSRIALAKFFSFLVLVFASLFFGVFCFAPECMYVPTPLGVPLSIVSVPGLILLSIAVSGMFVCFARSNDRALGLVAKTGGVA
jgi:hypothetical protein